MGMLLVAGVLIGGAYYIGTLQTPQPTAVSRITPVPSTISNETVNWKIYTDAKNKLSFKYPTGWQVTGNSQADGTFSLLIKSPTQLIIKYSANISGVGGSCGSDINIDIGSDSIGIFQIPLNLFYFGDKEKHTIKQAYVIRESTPCPNLPFFAVPRLHGLNSITIYYGTIHNGEATEISDKMFKSTELETAKIILSTFQVFENLQETSSWKSYLINGFSLKMPPQLTKLSADNADYIFTSKTGSQFDVTVYPNKSMTELENEVLARFHNPTYDPPYKRNLVVGGMNSTEYYGCIDEDCNKHAFILITNNQNKLYEIDFTVSDEDLDFYSTILSTIKFPQ